MHRRPRSPLSLLTFGALALLLLAAPRGAGAGVTAALTTANTTVAPGAEFDVEIRLTQAGTPINGFDAIVNYDPAALTFIKASPVGLQQGTLLTNTGCNTFHRFASGAGADTISDVLLCNGVAVAGPGQLYKLHFKASTVVQQTAVRFATGSLKFYNGGLFVLPVSSTNLIIGIGTAVTGVDENGALSGPALVASPNPGRGRVNFTSGWRISGAESLTVRDVQGRVVRVLALSSHQTTWDGRRESGETAADGIYFATLQSGRKATTIRFSLIH